MIILYPHKRQDVFLPQRTQGGKVGVSNHCGLVVWGLWSNGLPDCPWMCPEWLPGMRSVHDQGRKPTLKCRCAQKPLSPVESLRRLFMLFGEVALSLRHARYREDLCGFAGLWLKSLGRGSHVVRHGNNASWRRSLIGSLKEIPNCVQGQGGRIRSGSDRLID